MEDVIGLKKPLLTSRALSGACEEMGEAEITHATYLLEDGYDIRTVYELVGHRGVSATYRVYPQCPGSNERVEVTFRGIVDKTR